MRYIVGMTDLAKDTVTASTANETVASNIRAELARVGSSQTELARALGQNDMWISRRMSSKNPFSTDEVQVIADLLGVDVGALFAKQHRASAGALGRRSLYLLDNTVGPGRFELPTFTVESRQFADDWEAPVTPIFGQVA